MSVHWDEELAKALFTKCGNCKKDCPYKGWHLDAGCNEGSKKDG